MVKEAKLLKTHGKRICYIEDAFKGNKKQIINQVHEALNNKKINQLLEAIIDLRKLLSTKEDSPPINDIIKFKPCILKRLMVLFGTCNEKTNLKFEIARIFTNLLCGNKKQTKIIQDCGFVQAFMHALREETSNQELNLQIFWAFANLSVDFPIKEENIIELAINLKIKTKILIWFLAQQASAVANAKQIRLIMPTIAQTINKKQEDEQLTLDTFSAIITMIQDDSNYIQIAVDVKIPDLLIEFLKNEKANSLLICTALKCLRIIASGNAKQTNSVLKVLPILDQFLFENQKIIIRKEACFLIANIAAGNEAQKQDLIDIGLMNVVNDIFHGNDEHLCLQKEIIWIICNLITGACSKQIQDLIKNIDLLELLAYSLDLCQEIDDDDFICMILKAFKKIFKICQENLHAKYFSILKKCGALETIQDLVEWEDHQIHHRAKEILMNYFLINNSKSLEESLC